MSLTGNFILTADPKLGSEQISVSAELRESCKTSQRHGIMEVGRDLGRFLLQPPPTPARSNIKIRSAPAECQFLSCRVVRRFKLIHYPPVLKPAASGASFQHKHCGGKAPFWHRRKQLLLDLKPGLQLWALIDWSVTSEKLFPRAVPERKQWF